jgi:hypothetical protein
MPQSIPADLKREHVLRTLADLDAGIEHPFGKSTGYELTENGKRYAPKAVVGLSCRYSIGRILQPEEFSGGEAPGQANFVLRKLGFTVIKKSESEIDNQSDKEWSQNEVQLIVADYFDMLESDLQGNSYSKSEHRETLRPKLSGRSESSIESQHRNVSGVLVSMGLPYIEGYKPKSNSPPIFATEVEVYLDEHSDFWQQMALAQTLNPTQPKLIFQPNFEDLIEAPPERIILPTTTSKPWLSRKVRKIDFAERDARNRQLGKLSEQFVYDIERYRLKMAGRDDLAQRVVWASQDIGDGLGFDILSFDETDDSERMLEVKATGLGKFFPFYVTANELRCSADIPDQFQLFRVFDFGRSPRLYILHGSLSELCQLEPVLYRAAIN